LLHPVQWLFPLMSTGLILDGTMGRGDGLQRPAK